jgi:hypothetical protein
MRGKQTPKLSPRLPPDSQLTEKSVKNVWVIYVLKIEDLVINAYLTIVSPLLLEGENVSRSATPNV